MSTNDLQQPIIVPTTRRQKVHNTEQEVKQQNTLLNTGSTVKIEFETCGRFSLPSVLYFKDYTNKQVNDLILCSDDDLLETLLAVYQENCVTEEGNTVDLSLATIEEFLEIVIGLKLKFETKNHIHYWICPCQSNKDEKDRIINETIVDLTELQYKSIVELDKEIQELFAESLYSMSDEDYKKYLYTKYKNNPLDDIDSWTKEKEIQNIKITEPFTIVGEDGTLYSFHYPRLIDVLKAKKEADRRYLPKIKMIQNRREANVPLHELKEKKEEEIKQVKEEQARFIVLYAKAMCLDAINEKLLNDNEKYNKFSNDIPRYIIKQLDDMFNILDFGLKTEISLDCPICGSSEKRLLREVIDIRQLLPYGDSYSNKRVLAEGKRNIFSKQNIYFGV